MSRLDTLLRNYLDFDDEPAEKKVLSMDDLFRALDNAHKMGAIYQTSMIRGQVELLENLGFLKGEWFGCGDHLPFKMWKLTPAGMEALRTWRKEHPQARKVSGVSLKTPVFTPQEANLSSRLEMDFNDLFLSDEPVKKVG